MNGAVFILFIKYHRKIWFFARFALSLATPKILPLEKTQKIFGFLLAYSYLCNMTTKNLYMTIGLLTCKTLVLKQICPPQFCNRLNIQGVARQYRKYAPLLLSAPAFSGRDFCVNHLATERSEYA